MYIITSMKAIGRELIDSGTVSPRRKMMIVALFVRERLKLTFTSLKLLSKATSFDKYRTMLFLSVICVSCRSNICWVQVSKVLLTPQYSSSIDVLLAHPAI